MIDEDGYRANVGIVVCNCDGLVFWGKRLGQHSWQFPQGGIDEGETPEQAMYRELYEEIGLKPDDVEIMATTSDWLHYQLPKHMIRKGCGPTCIGQKQRWFLLYLVSSDASFNLRSTNNPEFDGWRWINYWKPADEVIYFKRSVYTKALGELEPALKKTQEKT
ncbi:MAG: RNA pyrophosphohydrolase [Thiotrichaceae bacterium]|nr:RNA pyrophosphohydrolase [Thiotrichaceae bacterium]